MKKILHKLVIGVSISVLLLVTPFVNFGQGFYSANVGPNQSICLGEFVILGGSALAGHSYSWSPSTNLTSTTVSQPIAYPTATTTYYLTEYDSATYVQFTDSVIITVNQLPATTHFPDKTTCAGVPITIGPTYINGLHYNWSPSAGLNYDNISQPTSNPLKTTTYFLTITLTATGCQNTDTVIVNVNPAPDAITGPDTAVCSEGYVTIGRDPVTGNSYKWLSADSLTTGTNSKITLHPNTTGTYFLTETNGTTGCQNTNSVIVTVNVNPDAKVGPDRSICLGENVPIGFPAVTGHTYQWTSNNGQGSFTIARPKVNPTITTIYHLIETITTTGCKNSNDVKVFINPLPDASTGPDKAICFGKSVSIGSVAIKGHTYSWDSIDGLNSNIISQPIAKPKVTTTYFMTETILTTGCRNTNSVVVTVNPLPEAITGPDKSLCYGRLTEIGSDPVPGHDYIWVPETGLSIPDYSQPAVTATTTTKYTLTEINTFTGCQNSNSVTVTVVHIPDAPTDPTGATELCQYKQQNQYSTKPVNGALNYKWTISPADAGITTGTKNSVLIDWAENFSGTATIMVSGLNACGASSFSIPLSVNIKQTPPTPTISLNRGILTSSSVSSNQWYDAKGPVTGAIEQTFTPTIKGDYYTVVETHDCSSKPSNMITVVPKIGTPTYINEGNVAEKVQIYPNPNSGNFTIQIPSLNNETLDLTIYNSIGKTVYQRNNQTTDANTGLLINISDLEQGVYLLKIHSKTYYNTEKIVVRK